jgi:hypothetical protein
MRWAEDYCKKEGLNFKELLPLIEETVQPFKENSPSQSQTGPASRTIQKPSISTFYCWKNILACRSFTSL